MSQTILDLVIIDGDTDSDICFKIALDSVLPQTRGPECLHRMLFIYAGSISIRKYLVLYCSLLCASLDEMKGINLLIFKKSRPGNVKKE